jgi:hypothetical protein
METTIRLRDIGSCVSKYLRLLRLGPCPFDVKFVLSAKRLADVLSDRERNRFGRVTAEEIYKAIHNERVNNLSPIANHSHGYFWAESADEFAMSRDTLRERSRELHETIRAIENIQRNFGTPDLFSSAGGGK